MNYTIEIESVDNGEKYWQYRSFKVLLNGQIVCEFERNYPSECYIIFEQEREHWMLCSENYHGGMTAINLSTNARKRFDPEKKQKYYQFWCLGYMTEYDQEAKTITVEGCYWGAPWERKIFDVSDPFNLPWPEISCSYIDQDEGDEGVGGGA